MSAAYIFHRLGKSGLVTPSLKWHPETLQLWKRIGRLGAFVAVTFVISPLGLSLVNGVFASFGPAALGSWNIMSRLEMLGLLPLNGMASAMIPFIAFNYGQGQYERIGNGIRFFLMAATLFILPIMALFIGIPHYLMLPFRADTEVLRLGSYALRVSALGHILAPIELAGITETLVFHVYPRLAHTCVPLPSGSLSCFPLRGIRNLLVPARLDGFERSIFQLSPVEVTKTGKTKNGVKDVKALRRILGKPGEPKNPRLLGECKLI